MTELVAMHRAATGDRARMGQFNLRFHLAIARASNNASLVGILRLLQLELELVKTWRSAIPLVPGTSLGGGGWAPVPGGAPPAVGCPWRVW
jgi:DNA-binding FadR family transcriptional regulator